MDILIVDDNKNNRMILRFLIEEYAQEHQITLSTTEVDDGAKAVEEAKNKHYELILMDIVMPNMDGIEATKRIRAFDTKTMIVAISAVDDNERKKIILQNGAEDYIAKPIIGDLFNARLSNYLTLITNRHKTVKQEHKVYNLYGAQVNSYHIHFFARNEEALSEFWEFYLLKEFVCEGLSDMVRFVFALGLETIQEGARLDIFVEENPHTLYMTLICDRAFDMEMTLRFAEKNNFLEYKLKENILTTRLEKTAAAPQVSQKTQEIVTPKIVVPQSTHPEVLTSSKNLQIFDVLEPYDSIDLEEYIGKLNSLILLMGGSNLEPEEVDELVDAMSGISSVLAQYTEFYALSVALNELIFAINDNREAFIECSNSMAAMAKAFASDLSRWYQSLFISGAPSINFLDDSIISNSQMIISFFKPQDSATSQANLDDIFDF